MSSTAKIGSFTMSLKPKGEEMSTNKSVFAFLGSAIVVLMGVKNAGASDDMNLCIFNPHPDSENISLPEDDAFHYPNQWTGDPNKANWSEPW
jgi:hypothetical protein